MRELGLGQYAESFCEVAQFRSWAQAGELEQVAGYGAACVVDAGFFRGDALGLLESVQGFADLVPHSVCLG